MSDMKLEIGQFIRFNGFISKIINIQISKTTGRKFIQFREPTGLLAKTQEKNITKSSFNLIDLIEVGDYVNGYLVVGSGSQMVNDEEKRIIYTNEQEYWCGGWANKRFDYTNRNRIQSVLTHEQYEANCYKVVE